MSGTRSPSKREPATEGWQVGRLTLVFYPFAAAAVWINLFMLSLLSSWLGFAIWSPYRAAAAALVLGVPAGWAAARWIRGLMDKAGP